MDEILCSLKKLSYLSRSQIQILHKFKSTRTTNKVLKDMEQYLSSFRDGENIYYLNKEGRERVNSTKVLKKTIQARHFIMRNSIYIAYGCPSTWQNEMKLEVKNKVKIISDALFQRDKRYYVVEVDHTQKMVKNRNKIERYRKLIELNVLEKPPFFIWITTTNYRKKQIEKLCTGLEYQIFTISDFH